MKTRDLTKSILTVCNGIPAREATEGLCEALGFMMAMQMIGGEDRERLLAEISTTIADRCSETEKVFRWAQKGGGLITGHDH